MSIGDRVDKLERYSGEPEHIVAWESLEHPHRYMLTGSDVLLTREEIIKTVGDGKTVIFVNYKEMEIDSDELGE